MKHYELHLIETHEDQLHAAGVGLPTPADGVPFCQNCSALVGEGDTEKYVPLAVLLTAEDQSFFFCVTCLTGLTSLPD